jgi:hypothetical protein
MSEVRAWGSFFNGEEGLGKRVKKGAQGGRRASSVDSAQSSLSGPPGTPPPALHYCSRYASSTELFAFEKRPPCPTLRHFQRAKVLQEKQRCGGRGSQRMRSLRQYAPRGLRRSTMWRRWSWRRTDRSAWCDAAVIPTLPVSGESRAQPEESRRMPGISFKRLLFVPPFS